MLAGSGEEALSPPPFEAVQDGAVPANGDHRHCALRARGRRNEETPY